MQLSAIYKRVTSLLSAAALASVILAGGLTTPVSGQFGRIGSGGPPGESRFSSDPPLVRQFQRASSLLQQGNVTEAIPLLQALLDHPADTYLEPEVASHDASDKPDEVPDQPSSQKSNRAEEVDAGAPRSLKQTVVNTLRSLPQDGRTHYEQEYGPVASGLVQRYRESSEPAFLREAIRRFALTDAGAQAGRMLAAYEMDHGHALASARLLQQVRENWPRPPSPEYLMMEALAWERAGMTGQSAKFVSLLREVSPADGFTLAGRRIVVPAAENAEQDRDWLQKLFGPPPDNTPQPVPEWLFSGGDPTRNAAGLPAAAVGTPLWQIPLFDEVDFANHDQYQLAVSTFAEQLELRETTGAMRIPATSPLVVDDLVVLRTLSRVQAFDLRTGQLRWKSAIEDDAYRRLLAQEGKVMPGMTNQQLPLADLIAQRAWDDATYGRLSSDGKYVFVLEDVGFLGPFRNYRNAPPNRFTPRGFNRLVAYEVRTGRIAWEVGDTREGAPLRLAGNFFLGSPLPYDGRLYCLAESSGAGRWV